MKEKRELLFSVTAKDCDWDYYRGKGKGGQKKNVTDNCARCTHRDSGASACSEDGRSQRHNKEMAFKKMAQSDKFQKWLRLETARREGLLIEVEQEVKRQMNPKYIKTEVKDSKGRWIEQTTTSTDNE